MNTVHVGSPRGVATEVVPFGTVRTVSVCEHTHLMQLQHMVAVVQLALQGPCVATTLK